MMESKGLLVIANIKGGFDVLDDPFGYGFVFFSLMLVAVLILYGILKGIQKAAGLETRDLRCPACTQELFILKDTQEADCPKCGTPILRSGEFVRSQTDKSPSA